jgi:hypothetical protein
MTKPLRENMVLLRAGQNANRVLHVVLREIAPVSEATGRWSRMDSIPFTLSIDLQGYNAAVSFCSPQQSHFAPAPTLAQEGLALFQKLVESES